MVEGFYRRYFFINNKMEENSWAFAVLLVALGLFFSLNFFIRIVRQGAFDS